MKKENYFRIFYFLSLLLIVAGIMLKAEAIKTGIIYSAIVIEIGIITILIIEYAAIVFNFKRTIFANTGLVVGILTGKLIFFVFDSIIPQAYSNAEIIAIFISAYFMTFFFYVNSGVFLSFFPDNKQENTEYKILDTSVIIDGRVISICKTGFLEGVLVLPRFVMNEIQLLSDSSDPQKRIHGKRALDKLQEMRESRDIMLQIIEDDYDDIREVDAKLLRVAKKWDASLLTNDHNLNRIAKMENIRILNINDLAVSLKLPVANGQRVVISLIKEGKDATQALAYMDDGTMIVVDNGKNYIGKNVEVEITQIVQNPSGRMVFSKFIRVTDEQNLLNQHFEGSNIKKTNSKSQRSNKKLFPCRKQKQS